jgi:hypothetical protein
MAAKISRPGDERRRDAVQVPLDSRTDSPEAACARILTRPEVQAAATMQRWDKETQEVNALVRELDNQVAAATHGDLSRVEGMLLVQSHTLDQIFNHLARRAYANIESGHLSTGELYLRLALKAQSQCRATLDALAIVKNPRVLFAKQANIAAMQQVNNGGSRTGEIQSPPNQLLEDHHGKWLDTGAAGAAISCDSEMEPVEVFDRSKNATG